MVAPVPGLIVDTLDIALRVAQIKAEAVCILVQPAESSAFLKAFFQWEIVARVQIKSTSSMVLAIPRDSIRAEDVFYHSLFLEFFSDHLALVFN